MRMEKHAVGTRQQPQDILALQDHGITARQDITTHSIEQYSTVQFNTVWYSAVTNYTTMCIHRYCITYVGCALLTEFKGAGF